jgi:hypothetical protein
LAVEAVSEPSDFLDNFSSGVAFEKNQTTGSAEDVACWLEEHAAAASPPATQCRHPEDSGRAASGVSAAVRMESVRKYFVDCSEGEAEIVVQVASSHWMQKDASISAVVVVSL